MEIHLRLGSRLMSLRHVAQFERSARLGEDLWAALADMVTHRGIRQTRRAVFIDQPGMDAPSGMPLLLWSIQIRAQHRIDRRLERLQPRRNPLRGLTRRRDSRGQRLAHRAPVNRMLVGQRPDRQTVNPMISTDHREQLHPRPHPPDPHLRDHRSGPSGR
jgi:hypothetical protein